MALNIDERTIELLELVLKYDGENKEIKITWKELEQMKQDLREQKELDNQKRNYLKQETREETIATLENLIQQCDEPK